jgi:arginine decarboxylase
MIIKTPTHFFLVSGSSDGYSSLNAFDGALLASGVGDTNLVRMSSILPPGCVELVPKPTSLPYGALVPVAYASLISNVPGETISSAVAIGIPTDPDLAGLIMEYSAKADKKVVENEVCNMVIKGMGRRNRKIKEIKLISASMTIETIGATFAGVVLWDMEE